MKEIFNLIKDDFINLFTSLFSNTKERDDSHVKNEFDLLLPQISKLSNIRERTEYYRSTEDITLIVNPNVHGFTMKNITSPEMDLLLLKHKINPSLVNNKEKRLLTLRAYFHNRNIHEELVLIDKRYIEYLNYYHSKLDIELIERSDLNKFKVNKNMIPDPYLLTSFTAVIVAYEQTIVNDFYLPIELFVIHYMEHTLNLSIGDAAHFTKVEEYVKSLMTIYAILFSREIPGDYVIINDTTATFLFYIENQLNNIEHVPENMEKVKPFHLNIVK